MSRFTKTTTYETESNGEPVKVERRDYPDGGSKTTVRETGGTLVRDGQIIEQTIVDRHGNVTHKS